MRKCKVQVYVGIMMVLVSLMQGQAQRMDSSELKALAHQGLTQKLSLELEGKLEKTGRAVQRIYREIITLEQLLQGTPLLPPNANRAQQFQYGRMIQQIIHNAITDNPDTFPLLNIMLTRFPLYGDEYLLAKLIKEILHILIMKALDDKALGLIVNMEGDFISILRRAPGSPIINRLIALMAQTRDPDQQFQLRAVIGAYHVLGQERIGPETAQDLQQIGQQWLSVSPPPVGDPIAYTPAYVLNPVLWHCSTKGILLLPHLKRGIEPSQYGFIEAFYYNVLEAIADLNPERLGTPAQSIYQIIKAEWERMENDPRWRPAILEAQRLFDNKYGNNPDTTELPDNPVGQANEQQPLARRLQPAAAPIRRSPSFP
ncbi:MAG: hypothetical protein LBF65_01760 [Holosporales bacterium]|nr:hypothetical protein [Holosporales bacterium]